MAFSHHRTLGPKFAFYPVIAPGLESGRSLDKSQAVLGVQAWAVTVPALSGLIVVALTLVLGWRMFGGAVGLIAALIVATHPASVLISSRIWPEATLTACLLAAVVLFHFFTSIRSWAGCLLAGLMYGLAMLTDASALFVLPAFWLWTVGLPDYKETVGGRWARVRALINPYFGVFLLGAVWIGKAWFDHTAHAFGDFALRRAVWTASAGLLPGMSFVNQTVQLFLQYPLLIAAIFSITAFWKKNTSPDQNSLVRAVWFFVVSLIGARWLFSPRSVWDERALALAVPFIAILAANGVCHAVSMIRSAILKNPDELPMNSR